MPASEDCRGVAEGEAGLSQPRTPQDQQIIFLLASLPARASITKATNLLLRIFDDYSSFSLGILMHYVYILRSLTHPDRFYVGLSSNPSGRVAEHNEGKCPSTVGSRPWQIKNSFYFENPEKAQAFERYLKSHSGRAFTLKHF